MNYKGIDVSVYQGIIDWEKVKPYIDFAIIRCGYGNNIVSQDDIYFKRNADECTRLGIPFGVYLYSYATNINDAKSEAEHTLRLVKDYKLEYPIFYDVEDKSQSGLPKNTLTDIVSTYCNEIEANGYYVGIYSSLYWFLGRLNSTRLDRYDKWVAEWGTSFNYSGEAGMWQYTSTESIPGINGVVDGDRAFKNYPYIIRTNGLNHLSKETQQLKYKIGDKLVLNGTLYQDSYGNNPGMTLKNTEVVITKINDDINATKPYNVNNGLGWVAQDELSKIPSNEIKIGDKVRIVGYGKASSDGNGLTAGGLGWIRTVLNIYEKEPYPYQVGEGDETTGFYKRDALEKI